MESLTESGAEAAGCWREAADRVDAYLRAHGVRSSLDRCPLVMEIIRRARETARGQEGAEPVALAIRESEALLQDWFVRVFGGGQDARPRLLARGRIALYVTQALERWPDALLRSPPPEAMRQALEAGNVETGPDLTLSSMIPRPFDYGPLQTLARETWQSFEWQPVARAFIFWACVYTVTYNLLVRL